MIRQANERALEMITSSAPTLVGVVEAKTILPTGDARVVYHAGPPLEWERMCGPLRGAIRGACVYEGWAQRLEDVDALVESGQIELRHNHSAGMVGPMTGMVTPSMPLLKVVNEAFGNAAYSTCNEGVGKVMRFGANDEEVRERLTWLQNDFGPALGRAIERAGGIDLRVIIAQALAMGDEMHQRNIAASALFLRTINPHLVRVTTPEVMARAADFLNTNEQFFLNLAMASAKASVDPIKGLEGSTVVSAMARNGTEFGIKVAGLGDQWFTAPVEMPQGLYFPGFSEADANPDIGDSAILECVGLGGMAMAAAPAVTQFLGLESVDAAYDITGSMYSITAGTSPSYTIAPLNFRGAPTGIDIIEVVESGVRPYINSGIAHRQAGVGQVGAGVVFPPMECFTKALKAFAEKYQTEPGSKGNEGRSL